MVEYVAHDNMSHGVCVRVHKRGKYAEKVSVLNYYYLDKAKGIFELEAHKLVRFNSLYIIYRYRFGVVYVCTCV